jgi:hypothetical protein
MELIKPVKVILLKPWDIYQLHPFRFSMIPSFNNKTKVRAVSFGHNYGRMDRFQDGHQNIQAFPKGDIVNESPNLVYFFIRWCSINLLFSRFGPDVIPK